MSVLLLYRMNTWLWESHVLRMEANMMASGTGAGSMDKVSTLVQPTSSTMDLRLQQEKCERPWLVLWIQWCFGWWIRMCHFHTFKLWYPKKVFVPPRSLGRWKASRKRNSGFLGKIKLRSKVLHLCCFSLFLFFKINSACFCGMAHIFGGRSLTIQGVCQWRQVRWMVVQRSLGLQICGVFLWKKLDDETRSM